MRDYLYEYNFNSYPPLIKNNNQKVARKTNFNAEVIIQYFLTGYPNDRLSVLSGVY